jgi:hypothetical protein
MPSVQLTDHFTLGEFVYSQTASREGIDNTPDEKAMIGINRMAETMEKVREILGANPVMISSGYRCPELNQAIGGSSTSAHMTGLAADFTCPAFGDPYDVCIALKPHMHELQIDQLIWEYADWVHIGMVPEGEIPREQTLTIDNSGTRYGFA